MKAIHPLRTLLWLGLGLLGFLFLVKYAGKADTTSSTGGIYGGPIGGGI